MKILYCPADIGGCAFYRLYLPSKYMAGLHQTTFKFPASAEEFKNYDLIIIQRQAADSNDLSLKKYIEDVQNMGKTVAYELDDYIWDAPSQARSSFSDLTDAETLIKTCKAVITSTHPLAEHLKRLNPNVYVIPNYIEEPPLSPLLSKEGVPSLTRGEEGGEGKINAPHPPLKLRGGDEGGGVIRLGYAGSISHAPDFDEEIIRALQYIKYEYKNKVELVFLGYMPEELKDIAEHHPFVFPPEYLAKLQSLKFDIGIIPCQVNTFNHCKSNVKYLEYSITGAATIASPVYPYNLSIMRDRGIIIKENRRDWWSLAINDLIENEDKRISMAHNGYNFVRDNYLIKNKIAEIDGVYKKIMKNKPALKIIN